MMLHPELLRAATTVRGPLLRTTALLGAVTLTHLAQAVLLAVSLAALAKGETTRLPVLLGGLLALVATRGLLSWSQRRSACRAGSAARIRLRDDLLQHLGELGPAHLTHARAGAIRATVVDGVEGVDAYLSRYLPQLVVTCSFPLLTLAAAVLIEPYALLALLPALGLALIAPRAWDRLLAGRGREHWDSYEHLAADYLEALQGMPTLRATGAVGRIRARLERRSAALHRATVAKMRVSLVDTGLTDLAVQGGSAAAALLACWSAASGRMTPSATYLLLLLGAECFRPVRDLSREWHAGYLGVSAADGIRALRETAGGDADTGEETADWHTAPEIRFDSVCFAYPTTARAALTDVSFTAEAGQTTAIVGPSGAGKSTLMTLLLRHRNTDAGRILVGGTDISQLTLASLRAGTALVSQETYLFHATVADNLRLARPDATEDELHAAAQAAGIHEEITVLPDSYATILGERGSTLSGGQRQRLALARALLAQAPVLILDEATSAVDERRETLISAQLRNATLGRTCLVIAHRLETVRYADRIVVLDKGRVAAVGDHAELLDTSGVYAGLVAAAGLPRATPEEERAA